MIISGLQPETSYSLTVTAYTTKGDGARSKPKLVSTTGAGNHICAYMCLEHFPGDNNTNFPNGMDGEFYQKEKVDCGQLLYLCSSEEKQDILCPNYLVSHSTSVFVSTYCMPDTTRSTWDTAFNKTEIFFPPET